MAQIRSIVDLPPAANGDFTGVLVVTSLKSSTGADREVDLRWVQLPGNIRTSSSATQIEDFVNGWIDGLLLGEQTFCRVKVVSLTPRVVRMVCMNAGEAMPPNWWVIEE